MAIVNDVYIMKLQNKSLNNFISLLNLINNTWGELHTFIQFTFNLALVLLNLCLNINRLKSLIHHYFNFIMITIILDRFSSPKYLVLTYIVKTIFIKIMIDLI